MISQIFILNVFDWSQILYAHSQDQSEQKPIKNFVKSSRGRVRNSRKFSGHPYIGRIEQSSLR